MPRQGPVLLSWSARNNDPFERDRDGNYICFQPERSIARAEPSPDHRHSLHDTCDHKKQD